MNEKYIELNNLALYGQGQIFAKSISSKNEWM